MVLLPLAIFLWRGIRGLTQFKWYLLAGEAVLLAGLIILYWFAGNEQLTEEDDLADEEPWEVYFREEAQESEWRGSELQEPEEEFQTVLLSSHPVYQECRKLVPIQGGEEISLGYFPFLIGKNKDLTDHCLNKPGVSRLHVKIEESEEGYLVTDLNSTNGTMINGRRLEANGSGRLVPGDELAIASERYSFR